jgi:hypothetical protein
LLTFFHYVNSMRTKTLVLEKVDSRLSFLACFLGDFYFLEHSAYFAVFFLNLPNQCWYFVVLIFCGAFIIESVTILLFTDLLKSSEIFQKLWQFWMRLERSLHAPILKFNFNSHLVKNFTVQLFYFAQSRANRKILQLTARWTFKL